MEISNEHLAPDEDSQESESSSNRSSGTRPNKFSGPKSTWREFTNEERLIHASVTRMRDQNLSIHLYNAHAMKSRHYNAKEASKLEPWSSKVSILTPALNLTLTMLMVA
jgi:RNA polymerase I specific transcription initiation factor